MGDGELYVCRMLEVFEHGARKRKHLGHIFARVYGQDLGQCSNAQTCFVAERN